MTSHDSLKLSQNCVLFFAEMKIEIWLYAFIAITIDRDLDQVLACSNH